MSKPAQPFATHAKKLYKVIQQQSWLLFFMIMATALLDFSLAHHQFEFTKNCLAGGVLAWISHWIFAKISLRHSGYHQRKQIVHNFYLAQAVKWVVVMLGFAIIFLLLQPLMALWVFIGFFVLQLGQIILLYRHKSYQAK